MVLELSASRAIYQQKHYSGPDKQQRSKGCGNESRGDEQSDDQTALGQSKQRRVPEEHKEDLGSKRGIILACSKATGVAAEIPIVTGHVSPPAFRSDRLHDNNLDHQIGHPNSVTKQTTGHHWDKRRFNQIESLISTEATDHAFVSSTTSTSTPPSECLSRKPVWLYLDDRTSTECFDKVTPPFFVSSSTCLTDINQEEQFESNQNISSTHPTSDSSCDSKSPVNRKCSTFNRETRPSLINEYCNNASSTVVNSEKTFYANHDTLDHSDDTSEPQLLNSRNSVCLNSRSTASLYKPSTQKVVKLSQALKSDLRDAASFQDQLHIVEGQQQEQVNSPSRPKRSAVEASEATTAANDKISHQSLGYQLRALGDKISALEVNHWSETQELTQSVIIPNLSPELVNETLNYFVNCRQRLDQMTKTYDDNDAYILLLQEKEVDLELAARIGQDLLRQNKQLKDSIQDLQKELANRQDDVQQLRHELSCKISLLDTFIEEEEEQQLHSTTSKDRYDTDDEQRFYNDHPTQTKTSGNHSHQPPKNYVTLNSSPSSPDEDAASSGFLSLNYHNQTSHTDPFSSLPVRLQETDSCSSKVEEFAADDVHHQLPTLPEYQTESRTAESQKLIESVTSQLVESNKRLCELQDELLFKSEQSIIQQDKMFRLEQSLQESDRRLEDISKENESLKRSLYSTTENQRELLEELKVSKKNFSDLLLAFLELQKETRAQKNMQRNSTVTFCGDISPIENATNNISFDAYRGVAASPTNSSEHQDNLNDACTQLQNQQIVRPIVRVSSGVATSSLHEELQMSGLKLDGSDLSMEGAETDRSFEDSDSDVLSDGRDSGLHTMNISASISPFIDAPDTETNVGSSKSDIQSMHIQSVEEDEPIGGSWISISSFVISTFIILCLSATFSTTSTSNLAHRLHMKLDK